MKRSTHHPDYFNYCLRVHPHPPGVAVMGRIFNGLPNYRGGQRTTKNDTWRIWSYNNIESSVKSPWQLLQMYVCVLGKLCNPPSWKMGWPRGLILKTRESKNNPHLARVNVWSAIPVIGPANLERVWNPCSRARISRNGMVPSSSLEDNGEHSKLGDLSLRKPRKWGHPIFPPRTVLTPEIRISH